LPVNHYAHPTPAETPGSYLSAPDGGQGHTKTAGVTNPYRQRWTTPDQDEHLWAPTAPSFRSPAS